MFIYYQTTAAAGRVTAGETSKTFRATEETYGATATDGAGHWLGTYLSSRINYEQTTFSHSSPIATRSAKSDYATSYHAPSGGPGTISAGGAVVSTYDLDYSRATTTDSAGNGTTTTRATSSAYYPYTTTTTAATTTRATTSSASTTASGLTGSAGATLTTTRSLASYGTTTASVATTATVSLTSSYVVGFATSHTHLAAPERDWLWAISATAWSRGYVSEFGVSTSATVRSASTFSTASAVAGLTQNFTVTDGAMLRSGTVTFTVTTTATTAATLALGDFSGDYPASTSARGLTLLTTVSSTYAGPAVGASFVTLNGVTTASLTVAQLVTTTSAVPVTYHVNPTSTATTTRHLTFATTLSAASFYAPLYVTTASGATDFGTVLSAIATTADGTTATADTTTATAATTESTTQSADTTTTANTTEAGTTITTVTAESASTTETTITDDAYFSSSSTFNNSTASFTASAGNYNSSSDYSSGVNSLGQVVETFTSNQTSQVDLTTFSTSYLASSSWLTAGTSTSSGFVVSSSTSETIAQSYTISERYLERLGGFVTAETNTSSSTYTSASGTGADSSSYTESDTVAPWTFTTSTATTVETTTLTGTVATFDITTSGATTTTSATSTAATTGTTATTTASASTTVTSATAVGVFVTSRFSSIAGEQATFSHRQLYARRDDYHRDDGAYLGSLSPAAPIASAYVAPVQAGFRASTSPALDAGLALNVTLGGPASFHYPYFDNVERTTGTTLSLGETITTTAAGLYAPALYPAEILTYLHGATRYTVEHIASAGRIDYTTAHTSATTSATGTVSFATASAASVVEYRLRAAALGTTYAGREFSTVGGLPAHSSSAAALVFPPGAVLNTTRLLAGFTSADGSRTFASTTGTTWLQSASVVTATNAAIALPDQEETHFQWIDDRATYIGPNSIGGQESEVGETFLPVYTFSKFPNL